MIYFDTDVLIHLLISQDQQKHEKAKSKFKSAAEQEHFFLSFLCLQETAFVLSKLGQKVDDIVNALSTFLAFEPVSYQASEMTRAIELAKVVGFQNINDCIHLAIVENYCSTIYTFNKADFGKLSRLTDLEVTILKV
ncbi:type II toxin-antitoxin system VapC family toxin [Dyadobacter crusticola]|uniref:type II toxin-antitoxin system VapC family toxin n=1 Tax=Dyadobacter crusticola TaxID=292407 RepID=UPI0004E14583|nr:PIN domain-containing protein [Dyadobacter crusticola]